MARLARSATLGGQALNNAEWRLNNAEWRLNPASERRLRDERRHSLRRRSAFQLLVVASLGGCAFTLINLDNENVSTNVALGIFFGWVALILASFFQSARAIEVGRRNWRALREEHGIVDGWAVEMTVLQGSTTTGSDHGVVWVEDGRLFFVGARTSFGLSADQVDSAVRARLASAKIQTTPRLDLWTETAAGKVAVGLRPLPTTDGTNGLQDAAALGWAVRAWLAHNADRPGQLPPLGLGPDAPTPNYLLARAIGTTLLWVTASLLAVASVATCLLFIPTLLLLVWLGRADWAGFGAPPERWRAWRDRRRLDAAVRQNRER